MCGAGRVIGGDCTHRVLGCAPRFGYVTLVVACVISMLLHAAIFWLPVMPLYSPLQKGALARSVLEARFREFPVARTENPVASQSGGVTAGRSGAATAGGEAKRYLPMIFPEKDPELISDMEISLEGSLVRGFMILHLRILRSGAVDVAEVVYSTLPEALSESLSKQFATARFSPAERDGLVVDADLLFRVDVE